MDLHLNILPYLASAVAAAIVGGGILGWLDLRLIGRSREAAAARPASDLAAREAAGAARAA